MKKTAVLLMLLFCAAGLTACMAGDVPPNGPEKIHDDVAAEQIRAVTISGDARSILIMENEKDCFTFYNGDLNPAHTYEVACDVDGDAIDIHVEMDQAEDNDVLGSVQIGIPQKEFEKIEVMGTFGQISLDTMNSDVLVHANDSIVYLNLEAERLKHDIILEGTQTNAFRSVSVFMDQYPADAKLDWNVLPDGVIDDPQNVLKQNGTAPDTATPVIRISHTKEISCYMEE